MSLQILITIILGTLVLTLASIQVVACIFALSKTHLIKNDKEEVVTNE